MPIEFIDEARPAKIRTPSGGAIEFLDQSTEPSASGVEAGTPAPAAASAPGATGMGILDTIKATLFPGEARRIPQIEIPPVDVGAFESQIARQAARDAATVTGRITAPGAPAARQRPLVAPQRDVVRATTGEVTPFGEASKLDVARELPGAYYTAAARTAANAVKLYGGITRQPEFVRSAEDAEVEMAKDEFKRRARTMSGGEESLAVKAAGVLPKTQELLGAMAVGGIPAVTLMMQPDAVENYRKFKSLGNDPIASFAAAQGTALAEGATERLGWHFLQRLWKLPATATKRQVLRELGVMQVGENAEEQINLLAKSAIDRMMGDPTATPEKLWAEAKETAAITSIITPLVGGATLAARKGGQAAQAAFEGTKSGRASVLARELERAVNETEFSGDVSDFGARRIVLPSEPKISAEQRKPIDIPASDIKVTQEPIRDDRITTEIARLANEAAPGTQYDSAIAQQIAELTKSQPLPTIEGAEPEFPQRKGFPKIVLPKTVTEDAPLTDDEQAEIEADLEHEQELDLVGQGVRASRFRNPMFNRKLGDIDRASERGDNVAQSEWLAQKASESGYGGVDEMAAQAPKLFQKLTEQWRIDKMGQGLRRVEATRGLSYEDSRLNRALNRQEGVGAPANQRMTFTDKKGTITVGKVTKTDWLKKAQRQLPGGEFKASRNWYRKLHDTFRPIFGERTPEVALAWLLSQQRASPSHGMMNVFRAMDRMRGMGGPKAGLNEDALINALRGVKDDAGMGAKLADFIDSEMGSKTRTVMGRDERGLQPAAIDVHAYRDAGFVDEPMLNHIRERFGEAAAKKVQLDLSLGKEPSYEHGVRFYNDMANWLNFNKVDGGGWTASEAQAVGWMAQQAAVGRKGETIDDVMKKNTRRVSLGLEPGTGSGGQTMTPQSAEKIVRDIAQRTGVNITAIEHGSGAYLGVPEGSVQIDTFASPEAVRDFIDALGYAGRQTSVIATRAGLKGGKQDAIDIVAPELLEPGKAQAFFAELHKIPGMVDLAPGYQQVRSKGGEGLRLLNFGGHWSQRQLAQLLPALKTAATAAGVDFVDAVHFPVTIEEASNDWEKAPDGRNYLDSLRKRGRSEIAAGLERDYKPERADGGAPAREGAGLDQFGQGARRGDRAPGLTPETAIGSRDEAVAHDRANPPKKNRLGQCHTFTWRKVADDYEGRYKHIIGLMNGLPPGGGRSVKIWHSFAHDPQTGNIWEPIADRWYTTPVMKGAFGMVPVLSLARDETRKLALQSKVYTDQTVTKPRGWRDKFLRDEDVDADWSIISSVGQGVQRPADTREMTSKLTLSPEFIAAHKQAKQIFGDYEKAKAAYIALEESHGGTVFNPDIASELVPAYVKNRELATAVHDPASDFVKRYYKERLAAPVREGKEPTVLFTAGGPGSGKSFAMGKANFSLAKDTDLMYDTSMSRLGSAREKIDAALDSGRDVEIVFVNRNPVRAYDDGVLNRVDKGYRRIVPIDEHARSHVDARIVIRQLAKHYADNPRVALTIIDNGGGTNEAQVVPVQTVWPMNYNVVYGALERVVRKANKTGRINDALLTTALSPSAEISPEEIARQDTGEPQQGREEEVGVFAQGSRRGIDLKREGNNAKADPSAVGMKIDLGAVAHLHKVGAKGFSALDADQAKVVAGAIADLQSNGLPSWLVRSVSTWMQYPTFSSSNLAMYVPFVNGVALRFETMGAGPRQAQFRSQMPNVIAHELGHALDSKGQQGVFEWSHFSTESPRMEFERGFGGLSPVGDLMDEAYKGFLFGPAAVRDYLSYPLGEAEHSGDDAIKSEVFAQMHGLYFTGRDTMLKHFPLWHAVMESVYGKENQEGEAVPTDALAAARERLQRALQDEGSGVEVEGALDGREAAARATNRGGDGGGQASVGMGVRTGTNAGPPPGGAGRGAAHGSQRAAGWNADQPGAWDAFVREWQNKVIDLKRVEASIERAGGVIREPNRPYLTEELSYGRVSARTRAFEKKELEPLLAAIKREGLTADEVGEYLWARHAPERNAQMDKINPGSGGNLSGLTNAEAAQKIAAFRAAGKLGALNRIASMVDGITRGTQQLLLREGLIDQQTLSAWNGAYKNYVPLFRDQDETPGTGAGFKISGPESKRAMGSERAAIDILAAVAWGRERAIIRAEKARVGRDLIGLAEAHPNPDFWRVDSPPMKRRINPSTGLVENTIDPLYRNREDVFIVKEKGPTGEIVERTLTFNPSNERALRLSRAMQNLDAVQIGGVTSIAGKISRFLANLATQWNPVFWATNFVRDVQAAGVNLASTKLSGSEGKVISRIPSALAGIADAEFRDGQSTWAKHYREYEAAGGKTGWSNLFEDLAERQKELESMIANADRSKMNPAKWATWAGETISNANTVIENSTRLAVYVVARERGMSEREAASLAKNITVNFNRKGNRSSAAAAWYMFFNANAQGTARMISGLKSSTKAKVIVGMMVGLGAALELINRLLGDRDRDEAGNNPYELISDFEKQRNWILMKPGRKDKGEAGYYKLALPYGFNIFPSIGRVAMEAVLGATKNRLVTQKRDATELMGDVLNVVIDAFSPLGQVATAIQTIAPTAADPFVQVAENKKFSGVPMVPEKQIFNKQLPNSELYFNSDNEAAKDLSRWLNRISGGNEIKRGAIDIHPGHIQHVVQTLTGGPGTFGMGMFDWGKNAAERAMGKDVEPISPARIPFVGKFYGEVDERAIEARFYKLKTKADAVSGEMKALKKAGDRDAADAIEEKSPALVEFAREAAKKEFRRDRKDLTGAMKETRELPLSDRAAAKRDIKRGQSQLYLRALEAYNQAAEENRQ